MITLNELNSLSESEAFNHLEKCCVSDSWVNKMIESRPFESNEDLIDKAASIWYDQCSIDDFLDAFSGHPKIGDVNSLKEKYANTADWAENEQGKMSEANMDVIADLAEANTLYEDKFGYIFIVSASGKSASEMLSIVSSRLAHNTEDELFLAINEQHKITVIRLAKLIEGLAQSSELQSHITTHALDTSTGLPAKGITVTLKALNNEEWKPLCLGVTNSDGRISDVLPPGRKLIPGMYVMSFNTGNYFDDHNQTGFYPEVTVQFEVTNANHYHIPLLISPFGYSTYRGS